MFTFLRIGRCALLFFVFESDTRSKSTLRQTFRRRILRDIACDSRTNQRPCIGVVVAKDNLQ